jgi:DNA-binding NarL/FixJ family response regulator
MPDEGKDRHVEHDLHTHPPTEPATVVIVDDDEDLCELLSVRLRQSGRFAVVDTAADTRSAVDVIAEAAPDVVLLDLLLPDGDGRSVLPHLAATAPRSMVVVLSGLDASETAGPALAAGAFAYLQKSDVAAAELADVLGRLLDDFRRALAGEDVVAPSSVGTITLR